MPDDPQHQSTDLESKLAALTPERRARVEARTAELRQEAMRGRWFGLAPKIGYAWNWLLAYFRLDPVAVCGMSSGLEPDADSQAGGEERCGPYATVLL